MMLRKEVIRLEGVSLEQLSSPEGQEETRRILSRNAGKLRKTICSGGRAPRGWVLLEVQPPSSNEGISQRDSKP